MPNVPGSAPLAYTAVAFLISVAAPPSAFAQAQPTPQMRSEAMSLMQICRADYDRLCSAVTPGGGRILACLEAHANQLGAACAQAMPRAEALKNSAVAGGMMPK